MKICQVLASRGEGGLERHVRDLSAALIQADHEVVVFADTTVMSAMPRGVQTIPIRFDRSRLNPLLAIELLMKLRHCHCDLIHAQANKAAALVSMILPWLRCPTVGTLHNVKHRTQAFNKLDHVIAVSPLAAQRLSHAHTSVILNGIEPRHTEHVDLRKLFGISSEQPVICAVGRLVHAKGFDILLDAVDGLPLSLIIVGDGPEREHLEARRLALKRPTQCQMPGHRSDAIELMASADGLVISSRHEGFPYVLVEALMTNTRVITTDISGVGDFFPNELIAPIENPSELRNRIIKFLDKPGEWSEFMSEPWKFAHEHLTLSAMAQDTLSVYRSLIDRTQVPPSRISSK